MSKNAKKVLAGVGILAAGISLGFAAANFLNRMDMLFEKYGLGDWEEDECECCNGGPCTCGSECNCDTGDEPITACAEAEDHVPDADAPHLNFEQEDIDE